VRSTVGSIREEMTEKIERGGWVSGVSKQEYFEYKIREALAETERFDLLVMGRPEGPGCYCAANHMLRMALDKISKDYDYIVIDCEAGMEHLSRRTTRDIDILLLVSDPTVKGIIASSKMKELVRELKTKVGTIKLVLNRVRDGIPPNIEGMIKKEGFELIATIGEDPYIAEIEADGKPTILLPEDSPLRLGAQDILKKLGI